MTPQPQLVGSDVQSFIYFFTRDLVRRREDPLEYGGGRADFQYQLGCTE